MEKRKPISVKIDPEDYDRIEAAAKKAVRPITHQLREIFRQYFARRERA